MSKTKLALLVFILAFGVNGLAFLFSKKSFTIDEVKSVWIYELPLTPSPLDAYAALDLGPHQGVVGTLFAPNHMGSGEPLSLLLAEEWGWNAKERLLRVRLKPDLRYQNGDSVRAGDFVGLREYLKQKGFGFGKSPLWTAWLNSTLETASDAELQYRFDASAGAEFDLEAFLSEVLTHPLAGAIHPSNLDAIRNGTSSGKTWISSGPYKIRKWNPKEIVIVSRDDFPVRLPSPFFRTLKYQSAPVKNPACDFLLGQEGEEDVLREHSSQSTTLELSVFWICRSFRGEGICADPVARAGIEKALSAEPAPDTSLSGKLVRFRIPVGSETFRNGIRDQIREKLTKAGAKVEETSYFFKNSKDTDLELQFVVTPAGSPDRKALAMELGAISTRLGPEALGQPSLMGEVTSFPLRVFMKKMKGGMFGKVFLEPDLEQKTLRL